MTRRAFAVLAVVVGLVWSGAPSSSSDPVAFGYDDVPLIVPSAALTLGLEAPDQQVHQRDSTSIAIANGYDRSHLARSSARPDSYRLAPQAIGPAGDAAASGLSRMDRFRNLADTGFEVGGQHYTINPHALTRLRASGRRHIDPESLIRSLDTVPTPGTPGSRIFTDPVTGTRWIVNDANDVISPWPAGFKG